MGRSFLALFTATQAATARAVAALNAQLNRPVNKVFPLKWYKQIDRSFWGKGPWDAELEDRAQWSDSLTGYPCLAIRNDTGIWSGYVGVEYAHPLYGHDMDDGLMPGMITFAGPTDPIHFIEPWPEKEGTFVDETNPKETFLNVIRMPDQLWFIGFDTMHHNDIVPGMSSSIFRQLKIPRTHPKGRDPTYKDLAYIEKTCATLALTLCKMTGTKTMDSTRRNVFAS